MSRLPTLKKSDPEQLVELMNALRLCASLASNAKDDPIFFGPLATQLRSLLTDNRHDSKALLIRMCKQFSHVPPVYSRPSIQIPETEKELFHSATLVAEAIEFSIERASPSQVSIPIDDLPGIQVAMFEGNKVTIGDLISWKANKYGGAHYADKVSKLDVLVRSYGEDLVFRVLIAVSKLLTSFGHKLLESTTSVEMFLQFRIDERPKTETRQFMFCAAARGVSSSWGLGIMPDGKLFFDLRGFGGNEISLFSQGTARVGSVSTIRAFHRLNEDFCSEIALFTDQKLECNETLKLSFPAIVHLKSLETYLNWNPYSRKSQDFSFYAGLMLWVDKALSDSEAETITKWMDSNTSPSKMIKLESSAFGRKPSSDGGMIFEGQVTWVEMP